MKRRVCAFGIIILSFLVSMSVRPAAAEFSDLYTGIWVSAIAGQESRHGQSYGGLELSGYMFLWNASVGYRSYTGKFDKDGLTAYVGIGAFNIVQVQVGTANAGGSVRIRSDLPVPMGDRHEAFPLIGSLPDMTPHSQWIISPSVEWSRGRFTYGIGVGVSF